jgi:hypothetical protein
MVLATDHLDIATAQADVIKLTVGKPGQRFAGDTGIIPSCERRKRLADHLNRAENRDGAERRRAGRLIGGHSGYPFQNIHAPSTLLVVERYLEMLQVQSNGCASMSALRLLHSQSPQFRRYFIGDPRSLAISVAFLLPRVGLLQLHNPPRQNCQAPLA